MKIGIAMQTKLAGEQARWWTEGWSGRLNRQHRREYRQAKRAVRKITRRQMDSFLDREIREDA